MQISRFFSLNSFFLIGFFFLEVVAASLMLDRPQFVGFSGGFAAFSAAFLGLEVLARKIFIAGSLRSGVMDGLMWVVFKFFVPLLIIFGSIRLEADVFWIFLGLVTGLVHVSCVLWLRTRFFAKND